VLNGARPLVAVAVTVPTVAAPPFTAMVPPVVPSVVTVLPAASLIATIGCVVNAAPLAAPAALVDSVSCVALPAVSATVCVTDVRPVFANVNV